MLPGLSTHVFLEQRLGSGLLEAMARSGVKSIQVFAARHHFDYLDRGAVREIGDWFRSNPVEATLHQPLYPDANFSKHLSPSLNLIHVEKSQRINAMDEVKRAIESAEVIPFTSVVLHLGMRDETWNTRALEHSMTAIEHLKAFAGPLGLRLLLENLQSDATSPAHLLEIIRTGHFDTVGVCLDLGHLHLAQTAAEATPDSGVAHAIAQLGSRIAQLHIHDNHGPFAQQEFNDSTDMKDEHLWPGEVSTEGKSIDWAAVAPALAALPAAVPGVLEIASDRSESTQSVAARVEKTFRFLESLQSTPSGGNM